MKITSKDVLVLAACTTITVFAWIAFSVYHAAVTSTITQVQEEITKPFSPKIDEQTLKSIRERAN